MMTLVCSSAGAGTEDVSKYLSKRVVEIEWDEVPYASQYDLEIYDGKNKKYIKTFSSKTNLFKLNVKMGKYYFRSRIQDRFDRISPWGELTEILIAPPPVKFTSSWPTDGSVFADKKTGVYTLPLAWEAIPSIDRFQLLLEKPEGKLVNSFDIQGNQAQLNIPAGQYQIRVKAILPDGNFADPSEPTPVLSVLGAKIQAPGLSFHRSPDQIVTLRSELATAEFEGELFYKSLEGTQWVKVKDLKGFQPREIKFDSTYTPGLYQLRLQAVAKGFTASDFQQLEFLVKPTLSAVEPIPDESRSFRQPSNLEVTTD